MDNLRLVIITNTQHNSCNQQMNLQNQLLRPKRRKMTILRSKQEEEYKHTTTSDRQCQTKLQTIKNTGLQIPKYGGSRCINWWPNLKHLTDNAKLFC